MRSIFALAALSSLAITTFAHAATPLEQYGRQDQVSYAPATSERVMPVRAPGTRPSDTVKPSAPRAEVGDEQWKCKLLNAAKQGCGFYRFYEGRYYYPEEIMVYSLNGQRTDDPVMHAPLSAPWQQASVPQQQQVVVRDASPTWQQAQAANPHREGIPRDADHYQVVEPTAAGGVIEYGRTKKTSAFEWFLGAALVATSAYDSYNYGGGYNYNGGYGNGRSTFASSRNSSICSNSCRLDLPGDPRPGGGGLQRR